MILKSASGRSPKESIPEILLEILLLAVFQNRGSTVHVCGKSCDWAAAEWEVSRKPCPESSSNLALLDSPANCAALSPLEGLNRENDIECGERKACFLSGSKFHYVKFNKV